ncbi:uncharacterized protein TNIN_289331 [Trichonephila inaurata madagascariensis]|uniref:DUF19 domain-containing protein n=1 Tax=Trichonephila inaurata madagascariensis TaxID=2747483 RepID=A0A8X6I8K8_9ARAC|nr:uncharacterized protein TNIN_289331 [Trichonephila inaurata madagascariensis]
MIVTLLIAIVLIQGNVGKAVEGDCNNSRTAKCYENYYPEEMRDVRIYPSKELLDRSCPSLLKMASCFQDYVDECVDKSNEFYKTFDVKFIREMCDKQSLLRNNFLQNVDCYQSMISQFDECVNQSAYAYRDYIDTVGYENVEDEQYHRSCLQPIYALACELSEIKSTCGYKASKAFFEVEKLWDSVAFTKYSCSRIDFEKEVKSGFFTKLEIPESRRRLFVEVVQYFSY